MVRGVKNSRVAYLIEKKITSIHESIVTWRKEPKKLNYIIIYPRNMSTPNISTTYPAITIECSTSFKAPSSLQATAKPSPAASKFARGYKDFKIPRVRLTDYFMLARMIS
jgi:hypothetical protein